MWFIKNCFAVCLNLSIVILLEGFDALKLKQTSRLQKRDAANSNFIVRIHTKTRNAERVNACVEQFFGGTHPKTRNRLWKREKSHKTISLIYYYFIYFILV